MSSSDFDTSLRALLEAGAHFGHQARRWNPKMEEYIYDERDGVHIFDLQITAQKLEEALEFVKNWVKGGKEIVFVGTKRQARDIVFEEVKKIGAPYVVERWLGGTITNWKEISKRIERLKELRKGLEEGKFDHYTKKEKVLLRREMRRLERFFGGLAELPHGPEALFVVDTHREDTAVAEATQKGIPIVGMVDSNADPDSIDYVIPLNDDAVRSIKLVVSKVAQAYAEGKELRKKGGKRKKEASEKASKKSGNSGKRKGKQSKKSK